MKASGPVHITATVHLRPAAERREWREYWEAHRDSFSGPARMLDDQDRDGDRLELLVSLSARDDADRRIEVERAFGLFGMARLPDIEDGINQLLGRDPTLHQPPGLAWGGLIAALAAAGIQTDDHELAALPLSVELDDEVAARLGAP